MSGMLVIDSNHLTLQRSISWESSTRLRLHLGDGSDGSPRRGVVVLLLGQRRLRSRNRDLTLCPVFKEVRQEVDPGGGGSNRTGDRRQLGNFRFDRPRSVGASVSVVVLDLVKLEPGGAKLASDPGVLRLDVILKSVVLKSCLIRPLTYKRLVGLCAAFKS